MQPHRIGAGFRTTEKSSAASLHLVSICTRRSGTYVEQLDFTGWKAKWSFATALLFMLSRRRKAHPVRC